MRGKILVLFATALNAFAASNPSDYFLITVVDEQTGRGVPMVELASSNKVRYYTDSNGVVAFYEPSLMDQTVFFTISSHGYEYPEQVFGRRGKAIRVTRGGRAEIKIKRLNIAERLYRVTGEGIYRDSVLGDYPVPIKHPLLNGKVVGQDSVIATPYRGRLYWFWGDTIGLANLNFSVSGATSEWPDEGGLAPSVGIDLTYFVENSGFSKKMLPLLEEGLVWIDWVANLPDEHGRERLYARYSRMKGLDEAYKWGIAVFNDEKEVFERHTRLKVRPDVQQHICTHPCRANIDGEQYLYLTSIHSRVKADLQHITEPTTYESFTCLVAGSRYNQAETKLDRDADGNLVYAWKANTDPIDFKRQQELIKSGKITQEEGWLQLHDVETGAIITPYPGSIYWNDFRRRWVMIVQQNVGEVWYAEGDTPMGPWCYAKKVVSHNKYTFYNLTQHPFFDQDGGRVIYFEGTYTNAFSGNPDQTPRYDYNQIMYRLSLDDPKLFLPAPVYRLKDTDGVMRYQLREGVASQNAWERIEDIPFFAIPGDRKHRGLMAVFATTDTSQENEGVVLRCNPSEEDLGNEPPIFYALPVDGGGSKDRVLGIVTLYEYRNTEDGSRLYSTKPDAGNNMVQRVVKPICRVWRNPMSSLILDYKAEPVHIARK